MNQIVREQVNPELEPDPNIVNFLSLVSAGTALGFIASAAIAHCCRSRPALPLTPPRPFERDGAMTTLPTHSVSPHHRTPSARRRQNPVRPCDGQTVTKIDCAATIPAAATILMNQTAREQIVPQLEIDPDSINFLSLITTGLTLGLVATATLANSCRNRPELRSNHSRPPEHPSRTRNAPTTKPRHKKLSSCSFWSFSYKSPTYKT